MDSGDINLSYSGIPPHHIQGAVSKKHLQSENIATGSQVGDCKGVSKPVRIAIGNAGSFCQGFDHQSKRVLIQRSV